MEPDEVIDESSEESDDDASSATRYRTQRRGGKGIRDIKTTARNGKVVAILRVDDSDEVLMMTARGKIQRIAASDISVANGVPAFAASAACRGPATTSCVDEDSMNR